MASPVHAQALKSKSSYKQLSSMSVESEMQSRIQVFFVRVRLPKQVGLTMGAARGSQQARHQAGIRRDLPQKQNSLPVPIFWGATFQVDFWSRS